MSRAGKINYLNVWSLGLFIGLMGLSPAFAAYNAKAIDAISRVTISGVTQVETGLITTFVINKSTVSGAVDCRPRNMDSSTAWHYTLIDLPGDPDNVGRYRVNDNLSLAVTAANGSLGRWVKKSSTMCSAYNSAAPYFDLAIDMANAFPITLSFYVKRRPIDNLITFPSMPLGGYIRSFGEPLGLSTKTYAIPIVLEGGTLQLPSKCQVNPTALMLDHGTVSAGSVSHRTSTPITYTCDSPVKATFALRYEADGNGALPLKDTAGKTGAVSKLTITDPQTGASGRSIEASIQTAKTFTVSSELSNITGNGVLTGNAWLIATQD